MPCIPTYPDPTQEQIRVKRNMQNNPLNIPTHYDRLHLTLDAPPHVIRGAYKSLAVIHHPDKTVGLPHDDRSAHAAIFRGVQEAFDVLGNASLKTAYDTELERHRNCVDRARSSFHKPYTSPKSSSMIRLTTPDEKRVMRAKAEQHLAYFREQDAKRDAEDALKDIHGLRFELEIWTSIAEEHVQYPDLRAYCAINIQKYMEKIAAREKQHEEWLANISKPKATTATSKQARSATLSANTKTASTRFGGEKVPLRRTPGAPSTTHRTASDSARADAEPKRADATRQRAEAQLARAQARHEELARKTAAKQARVDAKVAEARAAKDGHRQNLAALAEQHAERITQARAKA